jgi:hypothetical protein
MDRPLYVDPFLLFEDEDRAWEGAHDEAVDFCDARLELLKQAQGHRESMHWAEAHLEETPRSDRVSARHRGPTR